MRSLSPGEVHVWTARRPSILPPEIERTLSEEECDRARRFHYTDDRLAYVFAHAVLRDTLSRYIPCAPGEVRFGKHPLGKPFVEGTPVGGAIEFNLSHAGSLVLVAICGRRIGIDVEEIRPMEDLPAIAGSHFTPRECAFIFGRRPRDQERAFFRCWSRKEGYVKALGMGLSMPLNSFDTLPASGESCRWLGSEPGSTDSAIWQLEDVNVPEGYTAAVAVERGFDCLVYFEWEASQPERF